MLADATQVTQSETGGGEGQTDLLFQESAGASLQTSTNTHVRHVVNTVEVETPKIIEEAERGKRSVIREKINQVAEHIKNPQIQSPNKVVEMPVAVQRQTFMVFPQIQVVEKTVEGPQLQIVEQIVETPETQTIQGDRTSESLGTAPVCQVTQAEIGGAIEIGAPIPAESASTIFVTAPVAETSPAAVLSVQPVSAAEYVARARAITNAHAAPVVECVIPAPTVTNGASPVTYVAPEASFQLPQEIVYEQPASVDEANGSQPVEHVHPPAPLTCAAPAVTHATRLPPATTSAVASRREAR